MIWGDTLLEFSLPFDIVIANAYFKKTEDHLVMYKSGINKSQLNFLCLQNMTDLLVKTVRLFIEGV